MTDPRPDHGADRPAHQPVRTCVGCRATAPQRELLRVVLVDGHPVADPRRRRSGRGAYVHPRAACLASAGRGGLARALRHAVTRTDLDAISEVARGLAASRPDGVGASQTPAEAVESGPRQVTPGTPGC